MASCPSCPRWRRWPSTWAAGWKITPVSSAGMKSAAMRKNTITPAELSQAVQRMTRGRRVTASGPGPVRVCATGAAGVVESVGCSVTGVSLC